MWAIWLTLTLLPGDLLNTLIKIGKSKDDCVITGYLLRLVAIGAAFVGLCFVLAK